MVEAETAAFHSHEEGNVAKNKDKKKDKKDKKKSKGKGKKS